MTNPEATFEESADADLGVERKRWPLWKILLIGGLITFMPCVILTGLLATLVVPKVVEAELMAQTSKARADLLMMMSAIDQYAIENNGRYPERLDALTTPDAEGFSVLGEPLPRELWGNAYRYEPPAAGEQQYRLWTFGADGAPGGDGYDEDLDNVMVRAGR